MAPNKKSDFLKNYLAEGDVPAWFRGTSSFQLQAADGLQNALRDDSEQNTTHRVIACLQTIGLEPILGNRLLKGIMRLSRGNDLAFLYGLLTLYYKTPNCNTFSINEQLIMSSICHLDMITTLRELDRILPPGHPSQEVRDRQKRNQMRKKAYLRCLEKERISKKKVPKSPYFQKLVRPLCKFNKDFAEHRHMTTTTEPYEAYKDPHYEVPNRDRWFASYDLQQSRRIATTIIMDELNKIFTDFDAVRDKAENTEIICEKHFQMYMAEMFKKKEQIVKEKTKCLELLEMKKSQRRKRREPLVRRLEHDIESYQKKFHKERKEKFFKVKVISGNTQFEDKIIPVRQTDPYFKVFKGEFYPCTPCSSEADVSRKTAKVKCKHPDPSGCHCKTKPPGSEPKKPHVCGGCYSKPRVVHTRNDPECNPRLPGGCDCVPEAQHKEKKNCCKRPRKIQSPSPTCQKILSAQRKKRALPERKARESDTLQHGDSLNPSQYPEEKINIDRSPNPSMIFFKAATEHTPFQFDYERIFRFNAPNDFKYIVQRAFVKAMDHDCTVPREKDGHPNVLGAAEKCFHDMYKCGVIEKKEEIERVEEEMRMQQLSGLNDLPEVILRRKYPQKFFNPDDRKLMDSMLKDAFELMRKNPYFVLASLPEAHKLPMIREWIYKRYGKRYTQEDRIKFLNDSMRFFNELSGKKMRLKLSGFDLFKTKSKITYNDRECLTQQYDKMKEEIFKQLDEFIMSTSREFWFAMRPYLLPKGPPRNTYFAYMPARVHDILHFRLWKPDEFTDYKKYWDQRRAMERENSR